jgi:hypothetical protein
MLFEVIGVSLETAGVDSKDTRLSKPTPKLKKPRRF